jgi:hypothetical protein
MVATLNVAVTPAGENAVAVGVRMNEEVKPACATVNVWPATVMVVLRASPALGSSANVTSPGPEADIPAKIRTHEAPAEAVQAQPALVFTVNDPLPPEEGYAPPAGARVEHAPAWLTVNVNPATVIVPLLDMSGFSLAE